MNTHRESGVKFMSPVSLPNLRFPENHLIRVCMCVCVCVCVLNYCNTECVHKINVVQIRWEKSSYTTVLVFILFHFMPCLFTAMCFKGFEIVHLINLLQ